MTDEVLSQAQTPSEASSDAQINDDEKERTQSQNDGALSAEIVEPEVIEGDFVIAKPEIRYHI